MSTGRNDPCPCGSGKKYKKCCLLEGDPAVKARNQKFTIAAVVVLLAGLACAMFVSTEFGIVVGGAGLLIVGVALWLSAPPPRSTGGADPGAINFGGR